MSHENPSRKRRPVGSVAAVPPVVVGVGASAGGLEAFTQLLRGLPPDTGMGIVLVQHLDPHHDSALSALLGRETRVPVHEVTKDTRVEANHVYVIAPNMQMTIERGVLRLAPRNRSLVPHRPIDAFFESLAHDQGARAIGIVLSGTATDGTLGLEAIKAEGGITMAQDQSAKYDSMPRSAIASGVVDFVLPPAEIVQELARIARHPLVRASAGAVHAPEEPGVAERTDEASAEVAEGNGDAGQDRAVENGYKKILVQLRNHCGVDFALYKSNTIRRRINRRILLTKTMTPDDYATLLKGNGAELDALYADVLIGVTSFFRTPEAFDLLKRKVFPQIMRDLGRDHTLRVWVLGCSTGQEAYSIAMSFAEYSQSHNRVPKLQVFATDLNEPMLERARQGLYPKSLAQDLSPERLRRFFVEEEAGYRVNKALREQVVFARQNVLADPPFSRMDLISCRNLLIYLQPELQKKIIPAFHYALKPHGFLFLGASESVGSHVDLFSPVDKRQKIFEKKPVPTPAFRIPLREFHERRASKAAADSHGPARPRLLPESLQGEVNALREADRVLVSQFAPPGVLVDSAMQVLQFRGTTAAYLEPPVGKASFNILKMARPGLLLPLRRALARAKRDNKVVRVERVRVEQDGRPRTISFEIIPLKNLIDSYFLILFEPRKGRLRQTSGAQPSPGQSTGKRAATVRISTLEAELAETRDFLQAVQEQYEAANEELQASNEEVQSSNEELQSINEELETSKEELESTNEELTTVNEEMANRNLELSRLNADLTNLQASMNTAILLIGRDLTLRRFTPVAEKLFNLLPTDIGRNLAGIRHNLDFPGVEDLVRDVIDSITVREAEVRDKEGRWYLVRARPYLTQENMVDGAVLLLVDVTSIKHNEQLIKESRDFAQAIVNHVAPLLILDKHLRVVTANESFYKHFRISPSDIENMLIYDLGEGIWNAPKFRTLLDEILPRHSFFNDYEITHELPVIGRRTILIHARQLADTQQILLSFDDVTERIHYQEELRLSEQRYRRLFEAAQDGIILLDSVSRKISDVNPAIAQMLNVKRSDLLFKELWEIGLFKDELSSHAAFRELQEKGVFHREGHSLIRPDGTTSDIDITAKLVQDNDQTIIQCNVRDVTLHRRFEREASAALPGPMPSEPVQDDPSPQPPQPPQ